MLIIHERTIWLFFLLPAVLAAMGCDGIYRTQQMVEVSVTDSYSGRPLDDVIVELEGRYHDGWHPGLSESARNNKWFDEIQPKRRLTNEAGRIAAVLDINTIIGGMFPDFDPEKDRVTGVPYLFRITRREVQEVLTVLMRPGNEERGVHYVVRVLSIGDPTSVPSPVGSAVSLGKN